MLNWINISIFNKYFMANVIFQIIGYEYFSIDINRWIDFYSIVWTSDVYLCLTLFTGKNKNKNNSNKLYTTLILDKRYTLRNVENISTKTIMLVPLQGRCSIHILA